VHGVRRARGDAERLDAPLSGSIERTFSHCCGSVRNTSWSLRTTLEKACLSESSYARLRARVERKAPSAGEPLTRARTACAQEGPDQEEGLDDALDARVHRLDGRQALVHGRVALDDVDVAHDGAALLVGEGERRRVADPGVDTAAARVDPEDVDEAKVGCGRGRAAASGSSCRASRERERDALRRISSRTLTATVMKRQHRLHIFLSLQHVRIESSAGGA